jgi:hypothetical protein
MSDSFLSAVENKVAENSKDTPWFKTKEGWAEYYSELKRSIPEDVGDLLNIISDPEGVVRGVASFSKNELKSLSDLGAKGYAQRVAKAGSDFVSEAEEDPEAAADITSQAVLSLALKGGKKVKSPSKPKTSAPAPEFVATAPAPKLMPPKQKQKPKPKPKPNRELAGAALALNDVGQREEPRLFDMLRRNMAESQIDTVGNDRTLAPAYRFLRGVDAAIQKNVGEPVLRGLSNSPFEKGFQGLYEETVDARITNEILSRLNTEEEKAGDRDKLRSNAKKYFPSAKLRNL